MTLRPFWRYFGGKWRAAPRYPKPLHDTIVEPFAGAAGYSLRYPERRVILVEKYPVIAEIWRYLISASSSDVMRIPYVEHVDDLPGWVPQGARWLVGFCMNNATTSPCLQLSAGRKKLTAMGRKREGWSEDQRAMVASQVMRIKHWQIFEGGYEDVDDEDFARIGRATWFVDPPYEVAGVCYKHSAKMIDFAHLGRWCRAIPGQVIVCEAEGAKWLPFRPFMTAKSFGAAGKIKTSSEVIWENTP